MAFLQTWPLGKTQTPFIERATALLLVCVFLAQIGLALVPHWQSPVAPHIHIAFGPLQPGWENHPHPLEWKSETAFGMGEDERAAEEGTPLLSLYRTPGMDGTTLCAGTLIPPPPLLFIPPLLSTWPRLLVSLPALPYQQPPPEDPPRLISLHR